MAPWNAPCDCWRCRSGMTHVQAAGRLIDLHRGPPRFNDQRAIAGQKAGYGSQLAAERDRAKFPRKRK